MICWFNPAQIQAREFAQRGARAGVEVCLTPLQNVQIVLEHDGMRGMQTQ